MNYETFSRRGIPEKKYGLGFMKERERHLKAGMVIRQASIFEL